jgi:cytochrome c biogenesis protein CcdA/thiol-disulfide isomerase/thioredoxin
MTLLLLFAFLSGLATVVSPCVLPVLPMVLSTSMSGGRLRPMGVVLGLSLAFTAATLAVAVFAQSVVLPVTWLRTFAVVALGIFGLTMLVPALGRAAERILSPLARIANTNPQRGGFAGGLLMGAGLGLLWSPCVGPIMGSVIALAVSTGVNTQIAGMTLAYALGAGAPMLAIGYGSRSLRSSFKRLSPHSEGIRRVFGGLTVLACLAILLGLDGRLANIVSAEWNAALTGFEQHETVQKEITTLERSAESSIDSASNRAIQVLPAEVASISTPVPRTPEPSATPKPALALKDLGPAPQFTGLTDWINSEPLTLENLRGKVVVVDFWTFGCYNCRNTRPHVRALYDKYKGQGLEIVGIHTPEFAYERVLANVEKAARDQEVTWPVALDPDFKTWRAYKNRYWPAFYFIDAQGRIRYTHFGEGNYEKNELVVQQLLSETQPSQK